MPMPVLMALQDVKVMLDPNFDYVDLRNAMVPLMIPLASYDTDNYIM